MDHKRLSPRSSLTPTTLEKKSVAVNLCESECHISLSGQPVKAAEPGLNRGVLALSKLELELSLFVWSGPWTP